MRPRAPARRSARTAAARPSMPPSARCGCVCDLIRNMGKLEIPVWCYEWMPAFNWLRTDTAIPSRGGALVTGFDRTQIKDGPITEFGDVTEERLWANLKHFLDRVVPIAEQAGVKLAMHPDDPPLSPVRGLGRIMRSVDNYQRLLELVPSPVNGITLCQGNFTLMTDDLPAVIRHFGNQKKIFFVHFRDVRGCVFHVSSFPSCMFAGPTRRRGPGLGDGDCSLPRWGVGSGDNWSAGTELESANSTTSSPAATSVVGGAPPARE
ncbi:MAG: mannonate dehydratase [Planctomycetes bacterium]|nr:mannonate dehydratase [Planctomycetota bacterium]